MKVVVNWGRCESNAICVFNAPEVFRMEEADDQMVLLQERPDESLRKQVEAAVRRCPKQALSIEED